MKLENNYAMSHEKDRMRNLLWINRFRSSQVTYTNPTLIKEIEKKNMQKCFKPNGRCFKCFVYNLQSALRNRCKRCCRWTNDLE